jgi:hypothetical protein
VRSFRAAFKLFFDCFFSTGLGVGKFGVVELLFIAVINFLITDKQKHRASKRRRGMNVGVIKTSILLECLDMVGKFPHSKKICGLSDASTLS